jgi:pimeloyl-ACP methyl ester carboxylesterase
MQLAQGTKSTHAPLLFIHGTGHAAWCWQVQALATLYHVVNLTASVPLVELYHVTTSDGRVLFIAEA